MARWSEDLSNTPRLVTTDTIYSWIGARAGDTWEYQGKSHLITKVTRTVDQGYGAIWIDIECADGTKASTPDNMGHGTIHITGLKEIA